ncbi:DnaJ-domain-containing protein [Cubamyces sp. BRFM 1775]|nr:DnaJ-domain-containing protein [Cubamyces sp. BRFM 1775]
MSANVTSNLYDILGINKDATQEEVRKAYRKRALQTHPDRLPQDVSQADKKAAEEQFRLVNNAYEVLNNEQNRKLYDKHGVWPPPTEQPDFGRTSSRQPFDAFNDPFFSSPFGSSSRRGFAFTDPFELFNSLFGDIHSAFDNDPFLAGTPFSRSPFDDPFFRSSFNDPFFRSSFNDPFFRSSFNDPFFRSPFGGSSFGGSLLGPSPFGSLLGGPMFSQIEGGSSRMYSSRTEAVGRNGQWVSRSQMTRTVNGRTEVITKMIDADGNEHVTYSSPDGERHTINGIEQPAQSNRHMEGPGRSGAALPPTRQPPQAIADAPAQPASYYVPQQQPQAQAYSVPITSGPPQAQAPPANAYVDRAHSHRSRHSSHRDRHSTEDAPRRSHTSRKSSASSHPPADSPVAGHTRTDSASPPSRGDRPTTAEGPAERIYGGYDPAASAASYATSGRTTHGYARDPRRDSMQSGHSHHSNSHRDSASKTHHRSSRQDGRDYARDQAHDQRHNYERAAAEQAQANANANGHGHGHSQRGWRGW